MEEGFISWPDHIICPKCKEKVNLPKNWELIIGPSKNNIDCPYCKTQINYFKPGVIDPSISTQ